LADDLPGFLTAGGMTTPAIGIQLLVFVGESIFKAAPMQIEHHHIGSRERLLRQVGQEEFVDDPITGDADPTLRRPCRMSGDHDSAPQSRRSDGDIRAVVKRPYH
jgi:hypothetical protein